MVKKSITVGLIAFMALALAAPLFSSEDCDLPCCITVETSCCIQPEVVDCPMGMTACETPIALLLISGLNIHTNPTVDLAANPLADVVICTPDIVLLCKSEIQNLSASPPTAFLTPLRI